MVCPYCYHSSTDVKNSRPNKKGPHVWRRRYCSNCSQTFTTDEYPRFETVLQVVDNGKYTPFNRGILIMSISDAFRHDTEKGRQYAWDLSQTVLDLLIERDSSIVPTDELKKLCKDVVYRFDRAAGTQYAIAHQLPF